MERDDKIKALRPEIDFGEIEQPLNDFQKVLRQTLKLQNDILLAVCYEYLNTKYPNFSNKDEKLKHDIFYQSLKKDISFKKELLGIIKGMFTLDELKIYHQNSGEINKRLIEFIYKRIATQI